MFYKRFSLVKILYTTTFEDSANNHHTLANNNCNNASISKNVNDVESAITHDEKTIHFNSNFDISDANVTAINGERN